MSTQHPDNVSIPSFAENEIFSPEDELKEALFGYKNLGCDEQMWDAEGKEANPEILDHIFATDHQFFREHQLGQKIKLTYRFPNPRLEPNRAHVISDMLKKIPELTETAKRYYARAKQPIIEFILPQATSAEEIMALQKMSSVPIQGIPLLESLDKITRSSQMIEKIIQGTNPDYQRVFLARSDPALQSGMLAAILATKVALFRLHNLSKKIRVPIYPIVGVGSAPFRGHFTPLTALEIWHEYAGAATLSAQSSFKFDYEEKVVARAVANLRKEKITEPQSLPERKVLFLMTKLEHAYQAEMRKVLPLVSTIAPFVPPRRRRFAVTGNKKDYGRGFTGYTGKPLPRAIGFTAALYSIGLPPELFGLSCLTEKDADLLTEIYPSWLRDISSAAKYLDPTTRVGKGLQEVVKNLGLVIEPDKEHIHYSAHIIKVFKNKKQNEHLSEIILEAARVRNFLG